MPGHVAAAALVRFGYAARHVLHVTTRPSTAAVTAVGDEPAAMGWSEQDAGGAGLRRIRWAPDLDETALAVT